MPVCRFIFQYIELKPEKIAEVASYKIIKAYE